MLMTGGTRLPFFNSPPWQSFSKVSRKGFKRFKKGRGGVRHLFLPLISLPEPDAELLVALLSLDKI